MLMSERNANVYLDSLVNDVKVGFLIPLPSLSGEQNLLSLSLLFIPSLVIRTDFPYPLDKTNGDCEKCSEYGNGTCSADGGPVRM